MNNKNLQQVQMRFKMMVFILYLTFGLPSPILGLENGKSIINFKQTILDSWENQYKEIESEINRLQSSGLNKYATLYEQNIIANKQALIFPEDRDPTDVVLRRTRTLLNNLESKFGNKLFSKYESQLIKLENLNPKSGLLKASAQQTRKVLYLQTVALRRQIALLNPIINFDTLLFVSIQPTSGHMCDQYYAWNARPGGLYFLTGFKNSSPKIIDITANATITNGRLKGTKVSGGDFLSPDLSFDKKKILFAWSQDRNAKCYHLFRINSDGTELVQLTDGVAPYGGLQYVNRSQNDFDPIFLPNGRIAFISERRGGYLRCSADRPCPTYTLYSAKEDGTDLYPLSYHETNEWHPSVTNDGKLVYTRWDYVDRDDCIAHHIWICSIDGRDPRSYHGNYPLPLTKVPNTAWTSSTDLKRARPFGEWNIRAIPGTNSKFVATAGPHHGEAFGDLIIIDQNVPDDGKMSQVKGITTTKTEWCDCRGPYGTAWPLSEEYFLCNKNNTIILRDLAGNEELIYTASTGTPVDPIPFVARTMPKTQPMATWQGERTKLSDHKIATISISNVNVSDMPLPAGVKISQIRVIQVIPQLQQVMNNPRIGFGGEAMARMVLGTAPVEADGSAYFEAPVGKEIYFQLLDEKGIAIHSMRSGTYVHEGEQLSCVGCHEDKWKSVPPMPARIALKRPPSPLKPEIGGVEPINFHRLVKPVFEAKCAPCHKQQGKGPDMSYWSLQPYSWHITSNTESYLNGDLNYSGSRSIPGKVGARMAKLFTKLDSTHHNVKLTNDEYKRITLWLDCNSIELGAYTRVDEQRAGKLIWPELDVDSLNPSGVEQLSVNSQPIFSKVNFIFNPISVSQNTISFIGLKGQQVKVTFFTPSGKCVYQKTGLSDKLTLNLRHIQFAAGSYLCCLTSQKGQWKQMVHVIK